MDILFADVPKKSPAHRKAFVHPVNNCRQRPGDDFRVHHVGFILNEKNIAHQKLSSSISVVAYGANISLIITIFVCRRPFRLFLFPVKAGGFVGSLERIPVDQGIQSVS